MTFLSLLCKEDIRKQRVKLKMNTMLASLLSHTLKASPRGCKNIYTCTIVVMFRYTLLPIYDIKNYASRRFYTAQRYNTDNDKWEFN